MLTDLIPMPYRLLGGALALAAAAIGVLAYGSHRHAQGDTEGYARGHAEAVAVQGQWDAEKARLASLALQQSNDVRQIEERKAEQAQESHDAYLKQVAQAEAAADDLRAQRDGLRNALAAADADARVRAGAGGQDPGAGRGPDDAAVLRQLLGACSGRYADVAVAADSLRVQVTGLQGYVKTACHPDTPTQEPHP